MSEATEVQEAPVESALVLEVKKIVAHVGEMVVNDAESMEKSADVLKYIKTKLKTIDEQRTELVKPLNDHVKMINARFKAYSEPLAKAEDVLKGKVSAYVMEQRRIEAARQAEVRAKEEAARLEAEKAIEEGKEPPPVVEPEPLPVAAPTTSRGAYGAVHMRELWTYEVEDISKVPRAYITVDDAVVKQAIKEGKREIPGLRIYDKGSVVSR